MKKFITILILVAITIGMIGCSNINETETNTETNQDASQDGAENNNDSDKQTEIEFWTMSLSPAFDDYMNNVIDGFENENPSIKVNWTDVPWGNMETKILTAVAGDTAPDVVNLNPQFAAKLATADALVNPEDYMTEDEKNAYFDLIYKSNSFAGKTFALPWYITNSISIYNTELYEQSGIKVFKDYSKILEVSRVIKEKTGKYAYFPTFDGTHFLETVASYGIPLVQDGKAAFNNSKMIELVELYGKLYKENLVPGEVFTSGHRKAVEMYMSGDVATLITGPTMLGSIKNDALSIYEVTDVDNAPTGDNGYSNAAIMNIAVPKQKVNEEYEAAVKFAVFITNSENQLDFCKTAGTILPSTKETLKDPYFQNGDESLEGKARMLAAAQLETSKALIPPVEKLSELNEAIIEEIQLAMVGDQSAQEAIKNAEKKWNEILATIEHPIDF